MDDLERLLQRPAWVADANCRGLDPDLFFPERGEATNEAKAICRRCDVQVECLTYAINLGERHGIWGGMSERERRRIRHDVRIANEDRGDVA